MKICNKQLINSPPVYLINLARSFGPVKLHTIFPSSPFRSPKPVTSGTSLSTFTSGTWSSIRFQIRSHIGFRSQNARSHMRVSSSTWSQFSSSLLSTLSQALSNRLRETDTRRAHSSGLKTLSSTQAQQPDRSARSVFSKQIRVSLISFAGSTRKLLGIIASALFSGSFTLRELTTASVVVVDMIGDRDSGRV